MAAAGGSCSSHYRLAQARQDLHHHNAYGYGALGTKLSTSKYCYTVLNWKILHLSDNQGGATFTEAYQTLKQFVFQVYLPPAAA